MMQIFIDFELEEKPSTIKDRILSVFILAIMLYTGFLRPFISMVCIRSSAKSPKCSSKVHGPYGHQKIYGHHQVKIAYYMQHIEKKD